MYITDTNEYFDLLIITVELTVQLKLDWLYQLSCFEDEA